MYNAATGKQFTIAGVTIARFTNGKMVEGWVNSDAVGLRRLAEAKAAAT